MHRHDISIPIASSGGGSTVAPAPQGRAGSRRRLVALRVALVESLRDTYLRIDPRTLGLGRIGLAAVLLIDLVRRLPWLGTFYSNDGLIPNHTMLWRPPFPRIFSVFFMASRPEEAAVWFVVAGLCFFCFLIGYRTRLFHVLSFVMTTSLHNRILMAENWGGVAIGTLMLWTMFLPLGARFSVDAVRASLRSRAGETSDDLKAGVPLPDPRPVESLAVLGLLLQLAAIYWFNFVHKSGATWRTGTAIYYVLHQERIVTGFAVWLRDHLPFGAMKALTFATLVIEATAPALVLMPLLWRWTRPLAAVLLAGLHLSILSMLNLGIFSLAMVAFDPFLLGAAQWRLFARLVPRRGRGRIVYYDAGCGLCFWGVRVLARLDVHRRLRWIANRDLATGPAGVDSTLLAHTLLVVPSGEGDARRWTGARAGLEVLAALPLGMALTWPARLPGVRWLAERIFDAFARRRLAVSAWLGMCGADVAVAPRASTAPAPCRVWLRARVRGLGEPLVALVFLIVGAELTVANRAVPPWLRAEHRPDWMVASVMYPHLFGGWSLFAPDAPTSDQMVYVDAVTRDGRHVDPFNAFGSRTAALPVDAVVTRLGHDSFWCDYTNQIPNQGIYHQALTDWILRYPDRTGNPDDTLVGFEAYSLTQDTPPPGESGPRNIKRERFLQWP
ncbi:MAG TPA: DCC1-like thiol-disulfide oxidoreductase family protein [Polyangia bacterium]|nr:DCC1-like thiol-disulfide oxidoreductase family protein [Polyangia bacterium]